MSATQVRRQFGRVMREVASRGEPVIVERRGQPAVAVVSLADLGRLQQLRSADPGPANQALLRWFDQYEQTVDAAEAEWWLEFDRELEENPVILKSWSQMRTDAGEKDNVPRTL
jgi:prevent-host-death family protein